jgi:coproporphyrinogen III oxidase-like Fe-S oxidoreductase
LKQWLESTDLPPVVDLECLDADGRHGEVLMLGLRRLAGVSRARIDAACATPKRGRKRVEVIQVALQQGLLVWIDDHLALTPSGLLLADQVILDLL